MGRRSVWGVVCVSGLLLLTTGCKEKLTRVRYDTLQVGVDTRLNVETVLGQPDHVVGSSWRYDKHDRHLFVRFDFNDDGKVVGKSWADGNTGQWDGEGTLKDEKPEGELVHEKKSTRTVDK